MLQRFSSIVVKLKVLFRGWTLEFGRKTSEVSPHPPKICAEENGRVSATISIRYITSLFAVTWPSLYKAIWTRTIVGKV